jgi:alpha,alpha-trehalase
VGQVNRVLAVADELTVDGLVLRYRTSGTDDGVTGAEGTLTVCSFRLVSSQITIDAPDVL